MSTDSQNADVKHTLILSLFNFLYLMISVMLLAPGTYYDASLESFSKGYGAASAVYSVGILYSFFDKVFSSDDRRDTRMNKIVDICTVFFASLNIIGIVLYYFIYSISTIVYVGYFCIFLTAALAFFQAVFSSLDFIRK